MKKFLEEFKAFAFKGNVFDMAVGIIIGSAFTGIINSFVSDIISPLLGLFGTVNLANMNVVLKQGADAESSVILNYGAFLSAVINFLLMALVLFLMVKTVNKARTEAEKFKKKEEAPAEEPKKSDELVALEEIRDLLKAQASKK